MVRTYLRGGVWKNSEDEILKAAIMKYGKTQWARVASLLPKKSARQCKSRWDEWLNPSIKKTEWTRKEDEKLLHLAKLMPTQWRTIAPNVGRTAAQCLQRYQELLDDASAGSTTGSAFMSQTVGSLADARKLRPGEIDPNAEAKPARPDAVDMDEEEQEMLFEAKARLANTQGKKAKRKAREKQLQEARRMAQLQKRRELKAAGIIRGGAAAKRRKKNADDIDYNAEIPFQTFAPDGLHDTTQEDARASSTQFKRMSAEKVLGKQKHKMEKEAREKDRKRQKRNRVENLPEHVKRVSELNDPNATRKRSKLALPPPQVSESELELVAKLGKDAEKMIGQQVIIPTIPNSAAGANHGGLAAPSTDGVTSRSSLMKQARELIARANAPAPLDKRVNSTEGVEDIRSGNSGGVEETMEPKRAPDASGRSLARVRAQHHRKKLRAGFAQLPAPKYSFEPSVPEQPGDSGTALEHKAGGQEMDQGELEDLRRKELEAKAALQLELRSDVLKRNLPRPAAAPEFKRSSANLVEGMVNDGIAGLIRREEMDYPTATENGSAVLKRKHRDMENFRNEENRELDLTYLQKAKELVGKEVGEKVPLPEFINTLNTLYEQQCGKAAIVKLSQAEAEQRIQTLRSSIEKNDKIIKKLMKKNSVYLHGYMKRSAGFEDHFVASVDACKKIMDQYNSIEKLFQGEQHALPERIQLLRYEVSLLKEDGSLLFQQMQK
jgi:pre-mRNA-splicing factor CDC5/CEF1